MNRPLVIVCILLGIGLAAITLVLFLPREHPGPITCTNDEQCGGILVAEKFCKEGNVFGNGQENTCIDAGKGTSRCETTYGEVLIEECKNGCELGACV